MTNYAEVDLALIDRIVLHLYNHPSPHCLQLKTDILGRNNIQATPAEITRIRDYLLDSELIVKKESFIGGDVCIALTSHCRQILREHGKWSTYLESIQKSKRKSVNQQKLDRALKIGAFIVGFMGFAWGVYQDVEADKAEKALDHAQVKIKLLEAEVDSLLYHTGAPE